MAVSKRLRYEILRRDDHTCRYCGGRAPDVQLTVDHVAPTALGGSDEPANLVAACIDCNAGKSSSNPDQTLVDDVSADALRWATAMRRAAELQTQEHAERDAYVAQFDEAWDEWRFYGTGTPAGREDGTPAMREDNWRQSVLIWRTSGLDIETLTRLIERVMEPQQIPNGRIWRYFCGAVWRTIRERQDIARSLITEEVA